MPEFTQWRPHPWHGLSTGPDAPVMITAYIEITPFDVVKYEVDKPTGYLKVDRPQQTSSSPPTLYGFIPRTFCGDRVRDLCPDAAAGDGDPMDVCVISERPINRSDILLTARVVGGLQMVDGGEADDKIVAVLARDPIWADVQDLVELPHALIDRLAHYFETYKLRPGIESDVRIQRRYGREHAYRVIEASMEDYAERFA
ncbi:MAG: inorganic pyrophosphatase [Acidimicrobiia bacterium]